MTSILTGILLISGFLFILIFLYSLSKRNRVSGLFSLMCLAVAIYVIGYAFELRSQNVEQIKFFLAVEYFGAPFMPAFWLLFAYKFYFNRNSLLKMNVAVMIVPILTLFFCVTNDYHHLFYTDISAIPYEDIVIANLSKGPWYYVYAVYSYLILLLGIAVFYRSWRDSHLTMKTPALLMLIGTLSCGIFSIVYLAGLSPLGLDLAPFGLCVLAIFYFIALFRYNFLELGEIIRSAVFLEISDGIMVVDNRKRLLDFNNAAKKVFPWLDIKNIGLDLSCLENARQIVEHTDKHFEIEVTQDGNPRYYEFRVTDLSSKNRILGSVLFFHNITKQREMIEALDNMASYDSLTQVYNRRRLIDEAELYAQRAIRHLGSLSVLMIDIDLFKKVNDEFGHLTGDEVIRAVIRICKERLRSSDIIGRYGGEEFLVVLPESSLEDALNIAEHIRKHIEDLEIISQDNLIKITVSIGVASAAGSREGINVMQVINRADKALYQAKHNGRNRVSTE